MQLGFLDGKAGYIYARLLSQYEYQINAKLYELRSCGGQLNVAQSQAPLSPSVVISQETEVKLPWEYRLVSLEWTKVCVDAVETAESL